MYFIQLNNNGSIINKLFSQQGFDSIAKALAIKNDEFHTPCSQESYGLPDE
jgi:hypothetical protein